MEPSRSAPRVRGAAGGAPSAEFARRSSDRSLSAWVRPSRSRVWRRRTSRAGARPPRTPKGTPRSALPDGLSGGGARHSKLTSLAREPAQPPRGSGLPPARPRRAFQGPFGRRAEVRAAGPRARWSPRRPCGTVSGAERVGLREGQRVPENTESWSESWVCTGEPRLGDSRTMAWRAREGRPTFRAWPTWLSRRARGSRKVIIGASALGPRGPGVGRQRIRSRWSPNPGLGSRGLQAPPRCAGWSLLFCAGLGGWSIGKAVRSPA